MNNKQGKNETNLSRKQISLNYSSRPSYNDEHGLVDIVESIKKNNKLDSYCSNEKCL